MSNSLTWVEPVRPEIPHGWFVIVDGNNGKAYESYADYKQDYDALIALQENIVNPNPDEL